MRALGKNEIPEGRQQVAVRMLADQFADFMFFVLDRCSCDPGFDR